MENILIFGVNTRAEVNSAKKLDYNVYSSSYFTCSDFPEGVWEKHILNEEVDTSCGSFENMFTSEKLLENAEDYLDNADLIILCSGISGDDFRGRFKKYQKKIVGNRSTKNINDKYKFYNKIKNKFLSPHTTLVNDIDELVEILKGHDEIQFIIKPNQGSGGYNTLLVDYDTYIEDNYMKNLIENMFNNLDEIILQEYISGINISSSVLSSSIDAKTIINTRLLSQNDLGFSDDYRYCGNILPLDIKSLEVLNKYTIAHDEIGLKELNEDICQFSEEIIKDCRLIGSNGVDLILSDKEEENILNNDLYLIEVNPRFQGTYECVEKVLSINLLKEHINACNGELISEVNPKGYGIKEIVYAPYKLKQGNLNKEGLYDISKEGTIIEKNEPLITIIQETNNVKKGLKKINNLKEYVNSNIYPIK